jgi:hypothetical protein
MAVTVRPSDPPPPPPPFDPNLVPKTMEGAARQQKELEADHSRMKPHEPPSVMGNKQGPIAPPVGPQGLQVQKPYVFEAWPAWRWHRTKAPSGVLVQSETEEKAVCTGDGWVAKPFSAETGIENVQRRLATLDEMLFILGDYAEDAEDESAVEVLRRCLRERDQFARRLAASPEELVQNPDNVRISQADVLIQQSIRSLEMQEQTGTPLISVPIPGTKGANNGPKTK